MRLVKNYVLQNFQHSKLNTYLFAVFSRLHERFPWYTEQLSFLLVNIDNNAFLSREELLEASKVSPDIQLLNFTYKQLENLVDGLLAIGDKDGDKRLSFAGMTTAKRIHYSLEKGFSVMRVNYRVV